MRVVGGKARGRSLLPVPGDTTRPILDRVKTALFDILRPSLSGTRWLDMFAGSGGVGIEALSQGASHCTFVDIERAAVQVIRENLARCGLEDAATVRHHDAFLYLRKAPGPFDVIYIAPPQYRGLWLDALQGVAERPHLLSERSQVIVQIDPSERDTLTSPSLALSDERQYGKTLLLFFTSPRSISSSGGSHPSEDS